MEKILINKRVITPGEPAFIIAEIGVNHNGDPGLAREMVDAIADSGADCVKFQTFSAKEFVNSPKETYEYFSQGKKVKESMLEMFKRLEFKRDEFAGLFEYARKRGLIPMSTPTDRNAVDLLDEIGTPAFKVGSDDLVYTPFLEYVASKGKPVIISTGMAEIADIERAVKTIRNAGNEQILLLHCVSLYPTPPEKVNLRKMLTLKSMFDLPVGFSDHSRGNTACLGAVTLGATVLEKHFTMDKNLPGPDHWFSMNPEELSSLVRQVREMEQVLGKGEFILDISEKKMADLCHRSIVLAKNLPVGHIINESDLAFRRPGTGVLPYDINKVLGCKTRKFLEAGTHIELYDLEKVSIDV